jgi:hypothetical protein
MRFIVLTLGLVLLAPALSAQRHIERSSPPTAQFAASSEPLAPITPVSSGLGAIQFAPANSSVTAPQSLTRQLRFDDDRTRTAALSAVGVPAQYLQRGHVALPRSIDLQFAPIGGTDELDALLTVELDQHLVTAVLIPVDGNWRRIATLTYAVPFEDATTAPATWVHTVRSMAQKDRYRAVFRASSSATNGNYTENEAHLRIIDNKAVITISFESTARDCTTSTITTTHSAAGPTKAISRATNAAASATSTTKSSCEITQRWFQPDPNDAARRFVLVTATGHISPKEADDPLSDAPAVLQSHLRNFSCQPFTYSEPNQRYEPTAPNSSCRNK